MTVFKKIFARLSQIRLRIYSLFMDVRIGGKSLGGVIASPFQAQGATATQSSDYRVLQKVFQYFMPGRDDVFVDVGCGKGRTINYLLIRGFRGPIIGVECNAAVAEFTRRRLRKQKNVSIITGDILDRFPKEATMFYLFNPFGPETLEKLAQKIERESEATVRLIYYYDLHKAVLKARPGWRVLKEGMIARRNSRPAPVSVYEYQKTGPGLAPEKTAGVSEP